jgi:predicted lipoprotein
VDVERILHRLFHVEDALVRAIEALQTLARKVDNLMAVSQDIRDLLKRIDAATNEVAARLKALADDLEGGVSAADAKEIQGEIASLATHLESVARDPGNPVPPLPPEQPPAQP